MNIASVAARKLARRSSRRQFFKLLGAGSLGTGLFLTGTDVSLGAISGCVGCGGGPCNPCFSPAGLCNNVTGGQYQCKSCAVGGGCPDGCNTGGEWFCCLTGGARAGCRFRCSECNCPAGLREPVVPLLHGPADAMPAAPVFGRPPCTCVSDEPQGRGRESGRLMNLTGVVARKLAQRSSRRQFFKLLGAGSLGTGLFLTGTDVSLGSISGCVGCGGGPCNPCVGIGPICSDAGFPCKTCVQGGGCGPDCQTSGEWFCCQSGGRAGLPDPLLGVQLPAGLREPQLPLLRAAADAVQPAAALRRPAVHMSAARTRRFRA